jgi:anti-sigma factor RsiW
VEAYLDAEVDALTAAAIELHLVHCAECQQLRADIEALRTTLRRDAPDFRTPPALRAKIMQALGAEAAAASPRRDNFARSYWGLRSFWTGALGGLATAAAAAMLAWFVLIPSYTNPIVDEVLHAHVNSLMSTHLIDVVSTDRHTVKPWFAGHVDVSPAVADFAAQGYRLTGGRVDLLRQQRAAVVVYQHGAHVINVFCWAATSAPLPRNATRHGYHLAFWRSGDLGYAAVSDTGWDELAALERLLKGVESGPPPS